MKLYLVSLGAGILVGILYALLHVKSPAPPIVALLGLLGLLGMLLGEHAVPQVRRMLVGEPVRVIRASSECAPGTTGTRSVPAPDSGTPAATYTNDYTGRD